MAFDVEGARKAGYSDAEIAQYLAEQSSFDLKGAKSSGYSDGEVIAHLANKTPQKSSAELLNEASIPGLLAAGNINLKNRPRVRNEDGSISTVRSMSTNIDGREVLLPTVSDDGRLLSDQEAVAQYQKTGKHLGVFDSPDAATAYAERLHNEQAAMLDRPPEPSTLDKITGALNPVPRLAGGIEAAGHLVRSSVAAPVATIGSIVDAFLSSKFGGGPAFGSPESEQQAAKVRDDLMRQMVPPGQLSPEAQSQLESVTPALQSLVALGPNPAAVTGAVAPEAAMALAGTKAAATLDKASTAVPAAVKRVQSMVKPTQAATPGTMASVGAAGTDVATMRRQSAEALPVPIKLTKGQAERSFEQQRFEQEMAKDPALGAPLRDRVAEQNASVPRNFESWIDETGAKAASPIEVGRAVDQALVKDAARAKAEYRVKYQQADKAGEMAEPVSLQPLADYLNTNRAGRTSAPIMSTIADELKVQGVGDGALADGSIVGRDATLGQAEAIRKAVNKFVKDTDPNDVRVGSEIKGVIDQITEGKGGQLYKEARAARQRYAQLYEDNAIVRDLLATRKGTADRQVALENVFRRTILNGTREDLSKLRRTLQLPKSEEGMQAWRELQGQTLRHIIEESTKGVATDVRGNPIVSAAKMHDVIRQLDQGGKLDFVLSKKGAQQVRDMNELVKVIYTAPPGAVNTSNTASVILAAIGEAGATGAISGIPVPVISSIRLLTRYVKDRQTRQRILQALGEAEDKAARQPPAQTAAGATLH